jgi:hypothetical protein
MPGVVESSSFEQKNHPERVRHDSNKYDYEQEKERIEDIYEQHNLNHY